MRGFHFLALLALGLALLADEFQLALTAVDAHVSESPVDLDLFLAHAALGTAAATGATATTAALAVKVPPHSS